MTEGEPGAHWAIIVHGGAKEMAPEEEEANRSGVLDALQVGAACLRRGGSAVDAVEAAIRRLEDLPVFNAGRGSALNAAGEVEMCAGLMDGRDLSVGAVAAIRRVKNPIRVARLLLPEKEVILAGEGANLFARENGFEETSDEELAAEKEKSQLEECDTVGAVALDIGGNLAAGTSTGGLNGSRVGRIGDSPMPGSGLYADNHVGAVSLSGDGESIARLSLAARIMARLEQDGPEAAIKENVGLLPHVGGAEGDGGGIAIAKDGRIGWWHNSPHFAVATCASDQSAQAWLTKKEDQGE
jgi:L-asparaginase / beta-aspartyl-peptidase